MYITNKQNSQPPTTPNITWLIYITNKQNSQPPTVIDNPLQCSLTFTPYSS